MKIFEGFAGAGGFSEALRMLGFTNTIGIDVNADACATAHAAGHTRIQSDIRALDPDSFPDIDGWVSGPPCPTYAEPGKRSGRADYQAVLGGVATLGDWVCGLAAADDYAATYGLVADQRSALVLETLRFAFQLPAVRLIVAEQVPPVRGIWEEMCFELAATYAFESCSVLTVRHDDLGGATRRVRVFLVATRDYTPDFTAVPLSQALGWPRGLRINTRGASTAGGNEFSADGPSLSLTQAARTWRFTDRPGNCLTPSQAGILQTFPADYPWQGSRTSQFGRVADSVPPVMAAAVVGAAAGVPWEDAVRRRLDEVYGRADGRAAQLGLFGEVA